MIHESRTDMHFADLEIHCLKLFDFDVSRQIVERDGKERRCHLAFQNLTHAEVGAVVPKNADLILVVVGRHEKRKTLNVVPMNVCDKQTQIDWARPEFVLESKAESSNA